MLLDLVVPSRLKSKIDGTLLLSSPNSSFFFPLFIFPKPENPIVRYNQNNQIKIYRFSFQFPIGRALGTKNKKVNFQVRNYVDQRLIAVVIETSAKF